MSRLRWFHVLLVLGVILSASTAARADLSIRDRAEYRPSSELVLGVYDAVKGWRLTDEFQLNLEYQDGIKNTVIEAFNDYGYPTTLNFPDGDYYYLKVDVAGGLPIGIYDSTQAYALDSGESWVQWTLSGWWSGKFHTILAGDIIDGNFLHVRPPQGYRTFLGEGLYNDVEVFSGAIVKTEVTGYSFEAPLGEGSVLSPEFVPEPLSCILFAGSVLGGLGAWRRRRTL